MTEAMKEALSRSSGRKTADHGWEQNTPELRSARIAGPARVPELTPPFRAKFASTAFYYHGKDFTT